MKIDLFTRLKKMSGISSYLTTLIKNLQLRIYSHRVWLNSLLRGRLAMIFTPHLKSPCI